MDWNSDQIAAIIGTKELELIGLRMALAQAQARIKELEDENKPDGGRSKVELASLEGGK